MCSRIEIKDHDLVFKNSFREWNDYKESSRYSLEFSKMAKKTSDTNNVYRSQKLLNENNENLIASDGVRKDNETVNNSMKKNLQLVHRKSEAFSESIHRDHSLSIESYLDGKANTNS